MSAAVVWHYTTGELLDAILADAEIVPATAGLVVEAETVATLERIAATGRTERSAVAFTEAPAVWFSKRGTWEPTATKGTVDPGTRIRRTMTLAEMIRNGGGLARIGIPATGLHTWVEHRNLSGISRATARGLVRAALRVGSNPGDWLVHYGAVPSARWVAVQRFDHERWVDVFVTSPTQERGEK